MIDTRAKAVQMTVRHAGQRSSGWHPSASERTDLFRQAVRKALSLRQRLSIWPTQAVNPFQVAKKLGLETWFLDAPTLEGMYVSGSPGQIFVSSHRPHGRQAMTCAHELGHFEFGHGFHVDEHRESGLSSVQSSAELLANTFAAHFMATRPAVVQALRARGVNHRTITAEQLYVVANWLGIGYTSLVHHMRSALSLITAPTANRLLRTKPKEIRVALSTRHDLGSLEGDLLVADQLWVDRSIDAQVGDVVLVPPGCETDGQCLRLRGRGISALAAGVGRVSHPESGWSAFVRVARRNYSGSADYRHLAEESDAS